MNRDWSDAGVWGARVIPAISTGRKGVASAAASTLSCSGEKRGSFSYLKIRFAFITYRRATCATDTPGINACARIKRFSASNQNRFFPTMTRLKMSTIDGGHYQALPTRSRPPTLDAYPRLQTLRHNLRLNLIRPLTLTLEAKSQSKLFEKLILSIHGAYL